MITAALQIRSLMRRMAAAFLLLSSATPPGVAEDASPKVVSLDYCADQYVLALADREQILALSPDATDIHSFYRDRAAGITQIRPGAEQVLALAPDRVIRYWGGRDMLGFLRDQNIPVTAAQYGSRRETLIRNIRDIGKALHQERRAETKISDLVARFERLEKLPPRRLRALYLTPSGVTAGKGTFVDDLIKLAGFDTVADEFGLSGWRPLPLENLVKRPPDIIIASFFDLPARQHSNWSISRHKIIDRMIEEIPVIYVPGRYLSCNGIFVAEAADFISREAERLSLSAAAPAGD